jgi:hypothetical protein
MKTLVPVSLLVFALSGLALPSAAGQTPEQIRVAIERGAEHLRQGVEHSQLREVGLMAYALLKAGEPVDSPAIQKLIDRIIEDKFKTGHYLTDSTYQFYEGGCDLMALSEAGPKKYAKQIDEISSFIASHQNANGSWYYWARHDSPQETEGGDTSVTQYAVLGLWAATRAGVVIPKSVWGQLAQWEIESQCPDGGFAYHPGRAMSSTHSMTVNGISTLCIARLFLFPKGDYTVVLEEEDEADDPARMPNRRGGRAESTPRKSTKTSRSKKLVRPEGGTIEAPQASPSATRFGVLKGLDLSVAVTAPSASPRKIREARGGSGAGVSLARINKAIARGLTWLQDHFAIDVGGQFPVYYLYGLERACALSGMKDFNGHDWYLEGAATLIQHQPKEGGIGDGMAGANVGTSFAILFLSRATSKILNLKPGEKTFGGGLMIGGRGLPTNLSAIQSGAEGIQVRKLSVPVDQLLSELENPKSTEVEAVQKSIVEQVELGDPEKLIGQKNRLIRLAKDPRPEVRRTVIWALGRCATIHEVNILIKALDDPDYGVVVEANNALCWFSRRPNGFGHASDPVSALPENTSDQQKSKVASSWRKTIRTEWREWYENVRPYSERSLPIDLP